MPDEKPLTIATASVYAYRPEHGVPVRTTVGQIRDALVQSWGRPLERIGYLAPYRIFGNPAYADDAAAAEAAYVERLDRNAEVIMARLHGLADRYDGERLVLLCFERDPADCHRSWAARWLGRRGFEVEELGGPVARPALFDDH